jgi:hypothetical protein
VETNGADYAETRLSRPRTRHQTVQYGRGAVAELHPGELNRNATVLIAPFPVILPVALSPFR